MENNRKDFYKKNYGGNNYTKGIKTHRANNSRARSIRKNTNSFRFSPKMLICIGIVSAFAYFSTSNSEFATTIQEKTKDFITNNSNILEKIEGVFSDIPNFTFINDKNDEISIEDEVLSGMQKELSYTPKN